jgi:hypothetical protein
VSGEDNGTELRVEAPGIAEYKDSFVRVWRFAPGYAFGSTWIEVSSFSEIVELSGNTDGVQLVWENETTECPALKSIFIPRSSVAFRKLIG